MRNMTEIAHFDWLDFFIGFSFYFFVSTLVGKISYSTLLDFILTLNAAMVCGGTLKVWYTYVEPIDKNPFL